MILGFFNGKFIMAWCSFYCYGPERLAAGSILDEIGSGLGHKSSCVISFQPSIKVLTFDVEIDVGM